MKRNIRIEIIPPEEPEEILIRTHEITEDILKIQQYADSLSSFPRELKVHIQNVDYLVPLKDILFFETAGTYASAHTAGKIYQTDKKLYELESILPSFFVRCSKSTILNVRQVLSIRKELTGISEVRFRNADKCTYVSRMYDKTFRIALQERMK